MKCCSFQRKDFERHYTNMSSRFYAIGGLDDSNLKQAFLNSLPDPLGNETSKLLATKNLFVTSASLGEVYQNALLALEKFCNTSKFLKQVEKMGKKIGNACLNPSLKIKCKDEKQCNCKSSKKSHFCKHLDREKQLPKNKWKFLKKKKFQGKTSDRCYICKKKGHFPTTILTKPVVLTSSNKFANLQILTFRMWSLSSLLKIPTPQIPYLPSPTPPLMKTRPPTATTALVPIPQTSSMLT